MQVYCHRLLLSDHQIKYFLKKRKNGYQSQKRKQKQWKQPLVFVVSGVYSLDCREDTYSQVEIEGTHLSTQPITWLARTKSRSSGTRLEKWTQMSGQCPPSPC